MAPHRATVTGVAARAGVSIASVSRVLNGLASSPAMVSRVQAAADELGYRPHAAARSLKVRRTEQLALGVADVGNPVYVEMMRAVEQEARAEGYRLVISSYGSEPAELLALLASLEHGYADGLVLCPIRTDADVLAGLQRLSAPVAVIGRVPPALGLDNVRANSAGGVRLALEHLAALGRRRVAFVNGPVDTVPGGGRAHAFERVSRRLHLDPDPALRVSAADFTFAAGAEAAPAVIDATAPDAVLAGNDLIAVAVLHALHERGLRVPDDVAVVGMDDTDLTSLTHPALTSVSLGSAQRGRLAAQLLLARLREPGRPAQRVTVQPTLHVRGSSRPVVAP